MKALARIRALDRAHAGGGRSSGLWDAEYLAVRGALAAEVEGPVPPPTPLPVTGAKPALRARRVIDG